LPFSIRPIVTRRFATRDFEMSAPTSHQKIASRPATDARDANTAVPGTASENERVLHEVRRVLGTLRYGSVTLIVQDGRIVQVDTTSKTRLTAGGSGRGGSPQPHITLPTRKLEAERVSSRSASVRCDSSAG
jgi:hypothetical protein